MPFYKSQVTHWYNLSIINNMEKFTYFFSRKIFFVGYLLARDYFYELLP